MRINVTGNAGAGKTTLAAELGAALGLPVYSLDSIVWQRGWKKTPPVERSTAERKLLDQPEWVIDGVSRPLRQSSDLILFLDVPRHICAWRGLKRSFRYLFSTRPGLPDGCPEWKIIPQLLRIIRRFPSSVGQAIRREAEGDPTRYRVIRYPSQAKAIVSIVSQFRVAPPAPELSR
jgi:adenylate kinase family enzyme